MSSTRDNIAEKLYYLVANDWEWSEQLVNDDLRTRIGHALQAIGVAGYRDTTNTKTRPQWRASFSYHGQMKGETRYLQLFVPVDTDLVQVNCTVEAPALDTAQLNDLEEYLGEIAGEYAPGGQRWNRIIAELGMDPQRLREWGVEMVLHSGIYHRMVLARVATPLADLSDETIDLATRVGYRLAQDAREAVTTHWKASQGTA